jgi:hypothetical protein
MEGLWKSIWALHHVAERNKCFMWIALHNRLLTNSINARMGLAHRMCDHCREFEETGLHVLGDCALAENIWMAVVPHAARALFFGGDLVHWFKFNLQGNILKIENMNWAYFWDDDYLL